MIVFIWIIKFYNYLNKRKKENISVRFISWNVNGLRACIKKGFLRFFQEINADIVCLQEIKLSEGQLELELEGYYQYFNYAEKKGYSGTAIFTKIEPLSAVNGIGIEKHDHEGRVITLEYEKFYMVVVYTPNAKRDLSRLPYRIEWENDFRQYLNSLKQKKSVILCGDMNVAHQEIDLKNAKANKGNSGFTEEEREKFSELLKTGFLDTYRYLYPQKEDGYTWWSYLFQARERNVGWRIDYFLISEDLKEYLIEANIHSAITGSDHCPIEIQIEWK